MFVAGAAPKGSLFGTGKATGVVVLEEFKPKPGNPEFVVGGGAAVAAGNGLPETEVAVALGPKPELALLLPIFGQADVLLFCTGLVPVVGQGLVLSCVKLEAPVNGLMGALLALLLLELTEEIVMLVLLATVAPLGPQLGVQLGENPRFSLAAAAAAAPGA